MKLEQHELASARNLLVACAALGKAPQSGLNEMAEAVRLAQWVQQAIDTAEKESEDTNGHSERNRIGTDNGRTADSGVGVGTG